uniref:Uncharacterized protein n=2 Tax=Oryza sativa subsp. japonica TaxID=39947 RepID=Q53MY9_ORYSJ|nr:hypothetical protein [Oryza sativa Japonica Group]AAX96105.1 hypothetical protein LOC_Os11g20600 [Oryza sativa Japonica Group]ABA92904.1 hypothetical protein LOC_Os11g20600 [Oryza sativa Japonica Group]
MAAMKKPSCVWALRSDRGTGGDAEFVITRRADSKLAPVVGEGTVGAGDDDGVKLIISVSHEANTGGRRCASTSPVVTAGVKTP